MGTTATGAQNILMLGPEQQVAGYNTGAPLPFTVAAAAPGIPTTAVGTGTGITAAALQWGIKAWIAGRGLTAVGTISTPALAPSNDDVDVSWSALAAASGCYGYRVMRTVDGGTTWVAVADVWGRTTVTYTDSTAVGSEADLDDPADDETNLNYGLVQVAKSPSRFFRRVDGEFESDELTGDLGEPDVIPGFMSLPVEFTADLRAGTLYPVMATFAGLPTETALTGAPGVQGDFPWAEDEEDQFSLWGQEYLGGGTRPETGMGMKFFDIELSGLGTGLAKLKAKGIGTGWTEAGIAVATGGTVGTYPYVPVVKGQRGDATALTQPVMVKIIDAAATGTFTFKAKIGTVAAYGGAGTLMTGYYDLTSKRMILGGPNDEPWIELVDETGEVLGIDVDEDREPFSIYFPGDVTLLPANAEFTIPAQALVPRARLSISDTASTCDIRRIVRLPRFGPAHVKFLKTVDSVQSKFEFESATVKLTRTGTAAYQPGAAAKRPIDVDITGYVMIELEIEGRHKEATLERYKRTNERFALAMQINGGRIASAPGTLSAYRESILQTYAWCRLKEYTAVPSGPGLTKFKAKVTASQPPDGSAFMPLNRITSKQTWAFHAI